MRKVYLDAESLDLTLVPTWPEYEFVFIPLQSSWFPRCPLEDQT